MPIPPSKWLEDDLPEVAAPNEEIPEEVVLTRGHNLPPITVPTQAIGKSCFLCLFIP